MLQKKNDCARVRNLSIKALGLTACLAILSLLIQCKRGDVDRGPASEDKSRVVKGSWYEDTAYIDEHGKAYKSVTTIDRVYETADVMPEFNGDIYDYMAKNLHYPEAARKAGKEGRVGIKFAVDEHGYVGFEQVARSSGNNQLDAEAMRVVGEMPRWTPGKNNGQPVAVFFTLPVTFRLD